MSERYSRLFSLSENLYTDGSPVIISAGALLKDNDNGNVLVQLKFRNICNKIIKAVSVAIYAKDTAGRAIGEPVKYQFLDLSAKRDDQFAQKEPVLMPDNNTRVFRAAVTEVVFNDNIIWYCDQSVVWKSIPDQDDIIFKNAELDKQYRMEYGSKAGKSPLYLTNIWLCTCGHINNANEEKCQDCNISIEKLKGFDMEKLQADCSERLEKERAETAKKRKIIKIGVVASIAVVCVICISAIIPAVNYKKAVSLMENGEYEKAVSAFEILGDYNDSADLKSEALELIEINQKYDEVMACLDEGNYDKAIECFFSLLGDYKDAPDKLEFAKSEMYNKGLSLFENGSYYDARNIFFSLKGYKDSAEKIDETYDKIKDKIKDDSGRLREVDAVSTIYMHFDDVIIGFGNYKWCVLELKENSALLLAEEYLDEEKAYYNKEGDITWEECDLRAYLNNEFFNEFSDKEKSMIADTKVINLKGNDTVDKIFILSDDEVDKYFLYDYDRSSHYGPRPAMWIEW